MGGYELYTEGGYLLEEAVSALQKCIRRGLEKEALYWAIEINAKYPDYIWRRLVVIVTEDIGGAHPDLVGIICNLKREVEAIRKASKTKEYDLCILGFAILQMARSPKSREADDAVNEVLRERRTGQFRPDVPDFAKDMHTAAGRKMGRDNRFFWEEGARLENEAYPSEYTGWDPEHGDGYRDALGNKVTFEEVIRKAKSPQIKLLCW